MKNDIVNTSITLVEKQIQKDLIVKSQFYSSRMIIKEIYCTNPNCDCREVTLRFLKTDERGNEGKKLFSVKLNIDTLNVLDKISYDTSVNTDEIIAEFLADIDTVTRDRFNRNYKVDKGLEDDEKSVKHIGKELIDRILDGMCIFFNEIFDNAETITFRDEKSKLIFIEDQYCMNPKCLCNETFISFIVVNELEQKGENVFTLKYSFKNGKYDIESKKCTDEYMNDILKSFNKEEKQIREKLRERYKDMKIMGKQIHNENKINTVPQISTMRLGRNDACPCGSGKKYKKCCGR